MNSEYGASLERWTRPLPFAAFLALALCACFPEVLFGAESFFSRDYGVLAYPNIHFQRDSFWRGEIPFWNPYSHSGAPFLAQWGTMTLYPFSLIYLLLPLPWSLTLFSFFHVWLGGVGMYLLTRDWTKTNLAGALAGTIYVFNGIMFASFVWPNYLVTLGWMPFVVLLAERAWRNGGRWTVGCAIVSTLQMLSGAPEIIIFTWCIIALLWLCAAVQTPATMFRSLLRMLMVAALTTGLMAMQLVPFFELLKHSHRDVSFATAKWELPLWGWANFVVPLYNAFETPMGQYYQYDQAFLSSIYIGGIALAFAMVAVFRWPDVRVWILSVLGLLSLFLAFGEHTPVFETLRKILPFLGIARYPVKFLFVVAFVIPLLAGCGMAAVFQSRRCTSLYAPAILVVGLMLFVTWAARGERFVDYSEWPENFRQNVHFSWSTVMPDQIWPDAVANTVARAVLFLLSLGVFLLALRGKLFAPLLALGALALIAFDVRTHTPNQCPSLPSVAFTHSYWPENLAKPKLGEGRVMITPEAEDFLTFAASTNTLRVWQIKRRSEWSNLNLLDDVAKVNGSSTLQTLEQRRVEQALYSMTNRLPTGLLDFLSVSYISSSNLAAPWDSRSNALPLITAGQSAVFAEDAEALAAITNHTFDPRQTVILPPSAREVVGFTSNRVAAHVSKMIVKPRSVEAEIDAAAPTLAVVAQSYYPAWSATVDGKPAPLLRANLAFQAVPVPAGRHQLRAVYADTKFRAGVFISAFSLIACGVLCLRTAKSHD